MNKEPILEIAALLEANEPLSYKGEKFGFNMSSVISHSQKDNTGHECEITGCIAGWVVVHFGLPPDHGHRVEQAAKILGLSGSMENDLFFPEEIPSLLSCETIDDITPKKAAKVLRHLVKTGSVDWSVMED